MGHRHGPRRTDRQCIRGRPTRGQGHDKGRELGSHPGDSSRRARRHRFACPARETRRPHDRNRGAHAVARAASASHPGGGDRCAPHQPDRAPCGIPRHVPAGASPARRAPGSACRRRGPVPRRHAPAGNDRHALRGVPHPARRARHDARAHCASVARAPGQQRSVDQRSGGSPPGGRSAPASESRARVAQPLPRAGVHRRAVHLPHEPRVRGNHDLARTAVRGGGPVQRARNDIHDARES